MKIKLIHCTPIWLISNAIRMSRNNHYLSDSKIYIVCPQCFEQKIVDENMSKQWYCANCGIEMENKEYTVGRKDFDLIKRVGIKMKHESVLEFGYFIWEIDGISRACLQELARHRMTNLTVKSTRYTLKELRNESNFKIIKGMKGKEVTEIFKRSSKYLVMTDDIEANVMSINALENLRYLVSEKGISNDIAKYALPEAFKTKLQWGISLRSFINFYKLRSSKDALWEIRELANNLKKTLPNEYQELIDLYMEKNNGNNATC